MADPTEAEEPRYRLAYEEAVRVLERQEADLGALQTRALASLSAATLANTFLGGVRSLGLIRSTVAPTTPGSPITAGLPLWQLMTVLSIFGILVALCLGVLWPTGQWNFQLDPVGLVMILDTPAAKGASFAALYRDFAIRLANHAATNDHRLELRVQFIRAAIASLGVDVVVLFLFVVRR